MSSYQYRKSHCGDKTILRLSYYTIGFPLLVRWHLSLQWRHNERDGVSNHRRLHCLFNCLFKRRSKITSKLRVTGLCEGNYRWPVNSPHKRPATRKMFAFDDVMMYIESGPCLPWGWQRLSLHVGGIRRIHLVVALLRQAINDISSVTRDYDIDKRIIYTTMYIESQPLSKQYSGEVRRSADRRSMITFHGPLNWKHTMYQITSTEGYATEFNWRFF